MNHIFSEYIITNILNSMNLRCLFHNIVFLSILPDISRWDLLNVININYILYCCKVLSSLDDISN